MCLRNNPISPPGSPSLLAFLLVWKPLFHFLRTITLSLMGNGHRKRKKFIMYLICCCYCTATSWLPFQEWPFPHGLNVIAMVLGNTYRIKCPFHPYLYALSLLGWVMVVVAVLLFQLLLFGIFLPGRYYCNFINFSIVCIRWNWMQEPSYPQVHLRREGIAVPLGLGFV